MVRLQVDRHVSQPQFGSTPAPMIFSMRQLSRAALETMILIATGAQRDVILACHDVNIGKYRDPQHQRRDVVKRHPHSTRQQRRWSYSQHHAPNITGDNSSSTGGNGTVLLRGYNGNPIDNVTATNVTVTGQYGGCLDVSAYPATGLVFDTIVCDIPRAGAAATATVRSTTGTIIRNSTLPSRSGGGHCARPRQRHRRQPSSERQLAATSS